VIYDPHRAQKSVHYEKAGWPSRSKHGRDLRLLLRERAHVLPPLVAVVVVAPADCVLEPDKVCS